MGKVSKSKKRGKTNSGSAPYAAGGSPARGDHTSAKLLQDMKSIDHIRRARACELLGGLYSNGATLSSMLSLEALASDELLSLLRMRLVDTNDEVKTAATHALRAMASCKDPAVYQKVERSGIAGTVVQLSRAALGTLAPGNLEYAEALVAALHALCTWGESIVRELSSAAYMHSLLALATEAPSARLLCEATGLLSVLLESNPAASAAVAAATPAGMTGVQVLLGGMAGQWRPFSALEETARKDLQCARLHCVAALTHLLAAGDAGGAAVLEGAAVPDPTRGGEVSSAPAVMLRVLIEGLHLSDEAVADCLQADVPIDYSQIAEQAAAPDAEAAGMEQEGAAPTSNSRPEGTEDVTIGAEALERPSQAAFGAVRLCVEVIGNFAVMAKERMGQGGGPAGHSEDWSTFSDEEAERLMEQMAASMSSSAAAGAPSAASSSAASPLCARLLSDSGAMAACCALLARLQAVLAQMAAACLASPPSPLPSSVLFVLETMEFTSLCISNMCDYALVSSMDADAVSIAALLIACSQSCIDMLYGVTPSSVYSSPDEAMGKGDAGTWELSSCLDSKAAALGARLGIVAAAQALASLYTAAYSASASRPVALLPSPGLRAVNTVGVSAAVAPIISCLLRLLGVPILEVNEAATNLVSCLAGAGDSLALSQNENFVLTNALMKRLADPKAISTAPRADRRSEASLGVTAACLSAVVDLHSSDEPAYLEVFVRLNMKTTFNEILSNFKTKMQVDGVTIDREELSTFKEMYLNAKRFIKYKSDFV